MFSTTKQSLLAVIFAVMALFSTFGNAEAAKAGNVLCGLFLGALAIFAIFCFLGWFSQRGKQSSSNAEDEAE